MKEGIVCYFDSRNMGDEVQSIAAQKLLDNKEVQLLDRENLDSFKSDDKVRLLCNGWFMHDGGWPPSEDIDPYFISFHVAKFPSARQKLIRPELADYYKKFEPIGCRDHATKRLFESIGVEAYYSGCVTLTLPKYEGERNNDIVVADLFYDGLLDESYANKVVKKLIPKKYHDRVKMTTHTRENRDLPIEQKMEEAQELLDIYAKASMVVTSRIHCALPCLAMGTPVFFLDFGYARKKDKFRFEGIINLFHTVRPFLPLHENLWYEKIIRKTGLHRLYFPFIKPLKIDWENPPANKPDYQPIAEKIRERIASEFRK